MSDIHPLIAAAMLKRETAGLHVKWSAIPAPNGGTREYSAYAKDEAQKQAWIAASAAKGWVLA